MKKGLYSLFNKKWFQVAFSIIAAIICWAIVVFTISPEMSATIREVPVNLSSSNSMLSSLGLDIITDEEYKVSVAVEGPRGVVGTLDSRSVVVTPVFSSVTEAGTYELKLIATKSNSMDDYTISSITPASIKVKIDKADSKKFTVGAEIIGLSVAEGFMTGNVSVSPAEITIVGPEQDMVNINRIVAAYDVGGTLDKSVTVECPIIIYDNNGNELPLDSFKLDSDTVILTVPVYKQGVLDLDIEFTNVPAGFDTSTIKYVMSNTRLNIAASESVIDNLKTKTVGYVDLASFKIGETYTFEINLPSGYLNLDNIETINVTFPREDLASKKINISDIRLQNAPENYSVKILTQRINDVTIIGPSADVEPLLAGSVIAIVDMSQVNVESGTSSVPVIFHVTSNDTTWVIGDYTVMIEVEPN